MHIESRRHHAARTAVLVLCLALATRSGARGQEAAPAAGDPALWPEPQRAFYQDGPGFLLSEEQRRELLTADEAGRERLIAELLRDPLPETPDNELAVAIERRKRLAALDFASPTDVRARLLFLNGRPSERKLVDCGTVFEPVEIWSYPEGTPETPEGTERGEPFLRQLVVYRPGPGEHWRLWLPMDSKRALYTSEMEYWLEQWEELGGRIRDSRGFRPRRFDLQLCPEAKRMDEATGVEGLAGFRQDRPKAADYERYLAPPADLAQWARTAAATKLPEPPPAVEASSIDLVFPDKRGQRIVARAVLVLPPNSGVVPSSPTAAAGTAPAAPATAPTAAPAAAPDGAAQGTPAAGPAETEAEAGEKKARPELRLLVSGVIEQGGRVFDEFRIRYRLEPPQVQVPIALVLERNLRPGGPFVMRLTVQDEVGGAIGRVARGFVVPPRPEVVAEAPVPDDAVTALGESLSEQRIPGKDSLVLVPPEEDVVLGLWRAEALVTGERIVKVTFSVDGQPQLSRSRPPFSAELRLSQFPTEQVVRAEGYDAGGTLVAADDIILNQAQGALKVTIVEPRRGAKVKGRTRAKAEVVVPEGRRIQSVEFRINERTVATLERPPWQMDVDIPGGEEIVYVTVAATLDDGSRAEDTRFVNAPEYLTEVDVSLVELYTTVTDRNGRLVRDLAIDEFEVLEGGKPQKLTRADLVEDLPLTVGVVIDTSGSMTASLVEAQQAAVDFLGAVVRPGDKAFAMTFSDRPLLLMPPTDDLGAVTKSLDGLQAVGWTALHDAIVNSLHYFRGIRGQRALVLLSDGDDTASSTPFRDALEYARRSGVAVFTIGLNVSAMDVEIRRKLANLAEDTGGRFFAIGKAEELEVVYDEIEAELRSRYLLNYTSDQPPAQEGEFRTVEVKVKRRGLKARTARGYYP